MRFVSGSLLGLAVLVMVAGCGGAAGGGSTSDTAGAGELDSEVGGFGVRSVGDVDAPVVVSGTGSVITGFSGTIRRLKFANASIYPKREEMAFLTDDVVGGGRTLNVTSLDGRHTGVVATGLEPSKLYWVKNGTAIIGKKKDFIGVPQLFEFSLHGGTASQLTTGLAIDKYAVRPDGLGIIFNRVSDQNIKFLNRSAGTITDFGLGGDIDVLDMDAKPDSSEFLISIIDPAGFGLFAGAPGGVLKASIPPEGIGRFCVGTESGPLDRVYYTTINNTQTTLGTVVKTAKLDGATLSEVATTSMVNGFAIESLQFSETANRIAFSGANTGMAASSTPPATHMTLSNVGSFGDIHSRTNSQIVFFDSSTGIMGAQTSVQAAIVATNFNNGVGSVVFAKTGTGGALKVTAPDGSTAPRMAAISMAVVNATDNIFRVRYINGIYGPHVSIDQETGIPIKQVIVMIETATGTVTGVVTIDGTREAPKITNHGDSVTVTGSIAGAYDAFGKPIPVRGGEVTISAPKATPQ